MGAGGYGFMTMLHEIGHAIGLTHPGAYNAAPGGSITYADNAEYAEDTRQFSLMSYFDASELGANHGGRYAATPLLHDVAAIQSLYGANTRTRTGDTVYGFNATADRAEFGLSDGSPRPVFAIWDAGGTDTLDLSGYGEAQSIDLAPNRFTDAGGLTRNVAIADRVVIENGVGGRGADRLSGNDAANRLQGGGGDDTLLGFAGDDVLEGQDGDDRLVGGGGRDTLTGSSGRDTFVFEAGGPLDFVADFFAGEDLVAFEGSLGGRDGARLIWRESVQVLAFDRDGDGSEGAFEIARLDLEGTLSESNLSGPRPFGFAVERGEVVERRGEDGGDDLNGGDGADRLFGRAGDDALTGHGGNDEIHGEDGSDRLSGGAGGDRLGGGAGDDRLFGGEGRDRLNGGDGQDELWGEAGIDELSGEDGDDRLWGGDGSDRLAGGRGDDRLLGGDGDDELRGEEDADRLEGEAGSDRLEGGRGDDTLQGGEGRDTFVFRADFGRDVVLDFRPEDVIELERGRYGDIAGVMARAAQVGGDTIIAGDGGELVLRDVSRGSLAADDFRLV